MGREYKTSSKCYYQNNYNFQIDSKYEQILTFYKKKKMQPKMKRSKDETVKPVHVLGHSTGTHLLEQWINFEVAI